MKKKIIASTIIAILMLCIIAIPSQAAASCVSSFPNNDGRVKLQLKGLELDETKGYEYALVLKGNEPENWESIIEYTDTTADINVSDTSVITKSDKGYLYIREKDSEDNNYIVSALEVDLKIPYLKAPFNWDVPYEGQISFSTCYGNDGWLGMSAMYSTIQKVTDKKLIEKYIEYKENKITYDALEEYLPSVPENGWQQGTLGVCCEFGEYDGLYIVWAKGVNSNWKDIYGAYLWDGLPNATTLAEYGITDDSNNNDNNSNTNNNSNNSNTDNNNNNNITNPTGNSNTGSTNNGSTNTGGSSNSGAATKTNDPTVATTKLPQTGQGAIAGIAIIAVIGIGIFTYTKIRKYKGI